MSKYVITRATLVRRANKNLTPKMRVLKKFPKAACIEVSGCTVAVFSCGVIDSSTLLAMGHSPRQAWDTAAKSLRRVDRTTERK